MSARDNRSDAESDGPGDDSDTDSQSDMNLVVEDISPSLAPKQKISVSALMTKHIIKVTFVAIGIVLIFGFHSCHPIPKDSDRVGIQKPYSHAA